jgi:hypothetical protein
MSGPKRLIDIYIYAPALYIFQSLVYRTEKRRLLKHPFHSSFFLLMDFYFFQKNVYLTQYKGFAVGALYYTYNRNDLLELM